MLQIKTIYKNDPVRFDAEVNEAIADGWTLSRRTFDPQGFLAELEREIIAEAERCCENCKYYEQQPESEPCRSCGENADKWEAPDA